MLIVKFDQQAYMFRQTVVALTCPINRHMTRIKHNIDDWGLFNNPHLLMQHYIENGGAKEFEKRRAEFIREIEVPDPVIAPTTTHPLEEFCI